MKRRIVIVIVVVAAVAGLLYGFHRMDPMAMVLEMHALPAGSH